MQLHGTARHCRLLCQSLRALKSCATLAPNPPHSRRDARTCVRSYGASLVFVKNRCVRRIPYPSSSCKGRVEITPLLTPLESASCQTNLRSSCRLQGCRRSN
eukprot:scaffold112005_cov57-Phaeocystis_antarctica.AAC.5